MELLKNAAPGSESCLRATITIHRFTSSVIRLFIPRSSNDSPKCPVKGSEGTRNQDWYPGWFSASTAVG